MTDMTSSGPADDAVVEETERQHPQDPAEGPDPDDEAQQGEDVPRVHPQDPAEG